MTPFLQTCLFCGQPVTLVHVHGHYQCPVCHTNALPCCDGDNCDTNLFLHSNIFQVPEAPGPGSPATLPEPPHPVCNRPPQ